jgi:hypothetical protein
MESACALMTAGMETPATNAEPAALLISVRRDRLHPMATPPCADIFAFADILGAYAA